MTITRHTSRGTQEASVPIREGALSISGSRVWTPAQSEAALLERLTAVHRRDEVVRATDEEHTGIVLIGYRLSDGDADP